MQKKQSKRRATKRRTLRKPEAFRPPNAGGDFQKLVAVMSRLRAPKGCPWDREQTHTTLRTYLIEEAYEVLDALDSTDDEKFAEELGDLLLQVLFHAQIAHEEGRFDIRDVIREIYEKMIRRHPHVFGSVHAKTAADVLRNWEQIKIQERQAKSPGAAGKSASSAPGSVDSAEPASVLDGVPRALPALLEALQLTRKAARIGFDWPSVEGIFDKLTEETRELQSVLAAEPRNSSRVEGELGDILFVAVNLARFLHIDPEIALKKTCAKFAGRFRTMERLARKQGTALPKVPRPQMEAYWDQAKLLEQSSSEN
jgi:tetrapyrrole methylase family protein / MazG family protein